MNSRNYLMIFIFISILMMSRCFLFSAPPIFSEIGEEYLLNSVFFVNEGSPINFTVTAEDPDGDELVFWAENKFELLPVYTLSI